MATLAEAGYLGTEGRAIGASIRAGHRPWLNHCYQLNRTLHSVVPNITPHQKNAQEMLLATLFLRALGVFQSIVHLGQRGFSNETEILARCLIEISFKLGAIARDKEMAQQFIVEHDRQRLSLLKLTRRSSFLQSICMLTFTQGIDDERPTSSVRIHR